MTHTPGPWKVYDWDNRLHVEATGRSSVADVVQRYHDGESKANAHLIAAAPALLAVCEATLEYWRATGFAECEPGCACVVDQMRAAVAAARPPKERQDEVI
jgi:hypothetical protein